MGSGIVARDLSCREGKLVVYCLGFIVDFQMILCPWAQPSIGIDQFSNPASLDPAGLAKHPDAESVSGQTEHGPSPMSTSLQFLPLEISWGGSGSDLS